MATEEENVGGGVPEWIVTYGDTMSLLLTFFIMLVGMSSIKEKDKYQAIADSMRRQFGHDATVFAAVPGDISFLNSPLEYLANLGRAKRKDTTSGGTEVQAIAGENPFVQTVRPGKESMVGGVIFFDETSTQLTEKNKAALDLIIQQVAGKPQKIEVRGHTSRRPVDTDIAIRDQWDLAYQRCYNTMQYMIQHGIEPARIRLGSAAANEPIHSGIDPELRRRNARVEVLLWDERIDDQPASASKEG